jgi:hypothetical protein
MIVKIRPGDIESDRDTAIRLLRKHVNPSYDHRRFDWLYHAGPAGQGRLWMAEDASTGEMVGMAGAFPRRIVTEHGPIIGWLLGDFCVTETHRALGPALQLQRACLDDLAADGVPFCYDFPSRSMEAIYRRMRIGPSLQFRRLVRPLRVSHRLRHRGGALAGAAGRVLDLALGWGCRPPRLARGLEVALHVGRCGEEFSELARRVGVTNGICGERSAEYLNWRYLDGPLDRHELLTARSSGTLVGYVVVAREARTATLVDMLSVADDAVSVGLVRHAVARLWTQGVTDVRAAMVAPDSWLARLTRIGFRPRGETPAVVHALPGAGAVSTTLQHSTWFLTHGDRDG